MDYSVSLQRKYRSFLSTLNQKEAELGRNRKNRRNLEGLIRHQSEKLFDRLKRDIPDRSRRSAAASLLHEELTVIGPSSSNAFRARWQQDVLGSQNQDVFERLSILDLCEKPEVNLSGLPGGSWLMQLDFTLSKPYISRDDEANYVIDNPVAKDKVFGLPLIRPSSWKGNLRAALRMVKGWNDMEERLTCLFGNSRGSEEYFRAGRLQFHPTFFRRIGLEIINPHDRARKVGRNPILIECVPQGAKGTFSLLYVPFDLIGQPDDKVRAQAKEDLKIVAEAVSAMMLTYGFSAKRTSGYGMAKDEITDGMVWTRATAQGYSLARLSRLSQEVENVTF